jgi:SAM-dependent methyltransferase
MNLEDDFLDDQDDDEEEEDAVAEEIGNSRFGPVDNYDRIAFYYDLEYSRNSQGLSFFHEMARRAGTKARILEVACGSGRVSHPLLKAGFNVTGLDLSAKMLRLAEKKLDGAPEELLQRANYVQGDMRDLAAALGQQEFDLIFIAINSFQHLRTQADQLACLQSIRQHVAPAGRFIIDVFNPEDKESYPADGRMEYTGAPYNPLNDSYIHIFLSTTARPAEQKRVYHYFYDETFPDGTVKRTVSRFNLRYIYRFELQLLLERAGFSIEDLYGSYDFEEYGEGSPKLLYVCRRA